MAITTRFLHTRYRVDDLERTIKFYVEVLGLREVSRTVSPRGSKIAFIALPGTDALLEISEFKDSGPVKVQPDLTHLAFEVESIEAFAKHSTALGYPLTDGPHKTSSGSVIAFIDGPEGYEIELIQKASR